MLLLVSGNLSPVTAYPTYAFHARLHKHLFMISWCPCWSCLLLGNYPSQNYLHPQLNVYHHICCPTLCAISLCYSTTKWSKRFKSKSFVYEHHLFKRTFYTNCNSIVNPLNLHLAQKLYFSSQPKLCHIRLLTSNRTFLDAGGKYTSKYSAYGLAPCRLIPGLLIL